MKKVINIISGIPLLGKKIEELIIKKEGGQIYSTYIRKKYEKEYKVKVGLFSYGGCFDPTFNRGGEVEIGNYCSIAKNVHYFGANHPMNAVTSSAIFYNKTFGLTVIDVPRNKLVIGNDVWIGYGVIITAGCKKIGDGAVIGAGSVVTKNVEPYEVVGGVPAGHIRFRFNKNTIKKIVESEWYKKSPIELIKYYDLINSPELFCETLSRDEKKMI